MAFERGGWGQAAHFERILPDAASPVSQPAALPSPRPSKSIVTARRGASSSTIPCTLSFESNEDRIPGEPSAPPPSDDRCHFPRSPGRSHLIEDEAPPKSSTHFSGRDLNYPDYVYTKGGSRVLLSSYYAVYGRSLGILVIGLFFYVIVN